MTRKGLFHGAQALGYYFLHFCSLIFADANFAIPRVDLFLRIVKFRVYLFSRSPDMKYLCLV